MKLKEFQAAENDLLVTLGGALMGPALESLKELATWLHDVADWAKTHPETAKDLTLVAGGLTALSLAAGHIAGIVFAGSVLVDGFAALGVSLAPFAAGAAAAVGLAYLAAKLPDLAKALADANPREKLKSAVDDADKSVGWLGRLDQWFHDHISPAYGHPSTAAAAPVTTDPLHMVRPTASSLPVLPVPVVVTNPRDIAEGAAAHISHQMSLPQGGSSLPDPRIDPGLGAFGFGGM
jgi:hypothetical protein